MKRKEFLSRINESSKPIIVDLWAPWCGPCRVMEPTFKQTSQKYIETVDVLKINADDSPEVVKYLKVMSIPTIIGFANGKEILRRTGIQSSEALDILFNSTLHKRKPVIIPPAPIDRVIRSIAGLGLLLLGLVQGYSFVLIGIGGMLLFSAFYDRCPIYRTIIPRLIALFQESSETRNPISPLE